jgi:hypothetical protein
MTDLYTQPPEVQTTSRLIAEEEMLTSKGITDGWIGYRLRAVQAELRRRTARQIPGHGLVGEGRPFRANRERVDSTIGDGRALCACGALSHVLPSTNARKRWHREHKLALLVAAEVQR